MKRKNPVSLDIKEILRRLLHMRLPRFDAVVGIGRGGIVPAALVAAKLGCDIRILRVSYRDAENRPRYKEPVSAKTPDIPRRIKRILIVDDVSVSGKTLGEAARIMKGRYLKTMVFKGDADYVLFPEIRKCVQWPWKEK